MPDPYDPAANPDFLSALVSYWGATPALASMPGGLHFDEAPLVATPPYCVLSQTSSRTGGRGSKAVSYWEETFYQFAVYDYDQDDAVGVADAMVDLLDPIQDHPLQFANGRQMSWFREGATLLKVPEASQARTIWQQAHTYRVFIARSRQRA